VNEPRHTRELLGWVEGLRLTDCPDLMVVRAKASILDTVGVAVASFAEPVVRIIERRLDRIGGEPAATVWSTGRRTSATEAAFANGVCAHALDFDDVLRDARVHVGAVLVPALFAVAEEHGFGGASVLVAYLAGLEAASRVALALGPRHYAAGWHASSTVGTIACALATGKLMSASVDELFSAVAVGVSEAGGTRENFGTMAKPFHVGHAAACGVRAAELASLGMTGSPWALEGEMGFLKLYGCGSSDPQALDRGLPNSWSSGTGSTSLKLYPSCRSTHRTLDGLFELREQCTLIDETVESVEIAVPPIDLEPLVRHLPTNGGEGKFSIEYTSAAALLDGRVGLETFSDHMVERQNIQELMARVQVRANNKESDGAGFGDCVTIKVTDASGEIWRKTVTHASGDPERPLEWNQVAEKFMQCMTPALRAGSARFVHEVERLDSCTTLASVVAWLAEPGADREDVGGTKAPRP